jgi:hypothetical protein
MRKHCWLIVVLIAGSACGAVMEDTACPSGQSCGELAACTAGGDTCSCTPGELVACDGDSALYCSAQANGIVTESCGAPGCNATAGRCNECVPNTISCSADGTTLEHCGSDGVIAQSEACEAGCVAGTAGAADRCEHIKPAWLPDVCNEPVAMPSLSLASTTLDTQQDSACTGGVLQLNGTTFCIVRARTIDIGDLKVTGTRAIAFVADDALTVSGTLDVSADGPTAGPGAGTFGAGTATISASYKGGGGAGFAQVGGTGGGTTATEPGMTGGSSTQRLVTDRFVGGATTPSARCDNGTFSCFNSIDFPGGGGGGGALLIACRGKVSVTGLIDAGGGGGTGGGDHYTDGNIAQGGAPGGGSGGFVVFQGVHVEITGKLYANGGGGGAGCEMDNCRGLAGSDGLRSTSGAPGGDPQGNTCGGGIGGSVSSAPGAGELTFSSVSAGAGGGGGSMGRFEVFTPAGIAPVLTPSQASPAPVASSTSIPVE